MNNRKNHLNKPELMAPAGDWTMLTAVVNNGADAVYFGVDKLNMRAKAANFTVDELPDIVKFCKEHNVLTYLTINSIVQEEEIAELDDVIPAAKKAGVDRIICWDHAVMLKCKEYNIPFCISTQASVSNSLSAEFYKSVGAIRVVVARECSLEQIKSIKQKTGLEVEAFVHGAMCIAVSGRCFMSHHLFGKSANQGECVQPCRREFEIYDPSIGKSMLLGTDYVMSPQDLCSIEFIDMLIESGIDSFKIEGRKRSPEYAARVTSVYRKGIDLYFEGKLTEEVKKELLSQLEEVYNRGFSSGFYFDKPSSAEYAGIYGSKATKRKEYVGKVLNFYKNNNIAFVQLETGTVEKDDTVLIIGPTTGVVEFSMADMVRENENASITSAVKGEKITFQVPSLVRRNDTVYKMVKVK